MPRGFWTLVVAAFAVLFANLAPAQVVIIDHGVHIIRPPHPVPPPRPAPPLSAYKVRSVDMNVSVKDQIATVQLSQVFQNVSSQVLEAQLLFPMPENAAVSQLTLLVDGKELTGKLMKKEEARAIYESIVRQRRDPALLEYLGQGLFQTSVFPVPPQAERKVEIRYQQLLRSESGVVDLLLPIGTHKHAHHPVESLNVAVRIETTEPLKTLYSPTHGVEVQRPDDRRAVCKMTLNNVSNPDDFRLLFGTERGAVGMNVLSYRPKENEDGYFLMLASPDVRADAKPLPKTCVFVIDRSGSMTGPKFDQARSALKFLLQQLRPEDVFNVVIYDSTVESFRPELQRADEATIKAALGFADGLYVGGGTNIDGALQAALNQLADPKRPNYVLFLTDGIPTVGELNEQRIAAKAKDANKVNARIFNLGVGFDVNSRLLDRLSRDHRGQSVYVRPTENIEASVSTLYRKIGSPVLTDIALNVEFDTVVPASTTSLISRTYPRQLTDLFQGEQLVWVGRYRQAGAAKVTLTGVAAEKKTFIFPATFVAKSNDESFGFVEKLWATRRVGEIIDELDLRGHNQELVDELVRLSIQHGIMTPYTSFLADENVRLADSGNGIRAGGVARRELEKADGVAGFEQRAFKGQLQNAQNAPAAAAKPAGDSSGGVASGFSPAKSSNRGLVAGGAAGKSGQLVGDKRSDESNLRQVGQKSFFRKNNQWQDSTVTDDQAKKATRIRQFSREYFDLAAKHSSLAKYIAFDEPVLVNLGETTYQIDPEETDADKS
ncbi:MAG: VIT and vWA domain-containing protein [Planctomycetaceae bacterium]